MDSKMLTTRTDDALKDLADVKDMLDKAFEAIKDGDDDTCLELLNETNVRLTRFDNFLDEFSACVMRLVAETVQHDLASR